MKLFRFIKEFWKENKVNYIISVFLISFGSLIIYAKRSHNNFPLFDFLLSIPVLCSLLFLLSLGLALFLFWGNFEKWE